MNVKVGEDGRGLMEVQSLQLETEPIRAASFTSLFPDIIYDTCALI